jgi:hypothetical protein
MKQQEYVAQQWIVVDELSFIYEQLVFFNTMVRRQSQSSIVSVRCHNVGQIFDFGKYLVLTWLDAACPNFLDAYYKDLTICNK